MILSFSLCARPYSKQRVAIQPKHAILLRSHLLKKRQNSRQIRYGRATLKYFDNKFLRGLSILGRGYAAMNIEANLFKYWPIRKRVSPVASRKQALTLSWRFFWFLWSRGHRFSSPQSHRPLKYPSRHHGVKKKVRVANPFPFHIVLIGSCNEKALGLGV